MVHKVKKHIRKGKVVRAHVRKGKKGAKVTRKRLDEGTEDEYDEEGNKIVKSSSKTRKKMKENEEDYNVSDEKK